ncbi:hypothetical protein CF326_g7020 [Tilletia indica]|nr:hypothetical protein CF326_g7020 [Tilletia indica]
MRKHRIPLPFLPNLDKNLTTPYHPESARPQQREARIRDVLSLFSDLSLTHTKLEILQKVLEALDVDPSEIPTSVTQCRKMLATIHVIIWDVVEKLRNPRSNTGIRRYRNVKALRQALMAHPLGFFPRKRAKEQNLRDLLRHIFGC